MDDGGALLFSERKRRKLFWVDMNLVGLFYSWMRGLHGRNFERTVHTMYERCGLAPLYPSLIHEFQHFAMQSTGSQIAIDKVRYDIWEVAATDRFEFFGASFVALALDLCRFEEPPAASVEPLNAAETFALKKYMEDAETYQTAHIFFWNRPDLDVPVSELLEGVQKEADLPSNICDDQTHDRVWSLFLQFKGVSHSQLELDHPWNVFDVTELLCQLLYTWLLATKSLDVVKRNMAEVCRRFSSKDDAGCNGLNLPPETMALSLSLVLNLNSATYVKPITSDGLQQLENWLQFRMPVVLQGDNVFAPTAVFPTTLIQKLITEIKVEDMGRIQLNRFPAVTITGSCSDLVVKVDLHSSVLELDYETADMARLFGYWLRSPGGRFKHHLIVQQVDEAYSRMGWPPCQNSSLVEEIRSTLSSRLFSHEQAQARYHVWLGSFPEGIRRMKGQRSFVNFVAVVSMHIVEEGAGQDDEPSWELVEKARRHATAGGYHLLKPLLVRDDDKEEDAGVNEVVLYLVEELRYWKRLEWESFNDNGEEGFDYVVPDYPLMDYLRAVRLPDMTREGMERRLAKPNIALCRDVTEPVLRIVAAWQKKHGSGSEVEESKAYKSLRYCLYLHEGAGCMLKATQQDFEVCQCATSDDPIKLVALVMGECELGPLVSRLCEVKRNVLAC